MDRCCVRTTVSLMSCGRTLVLMSQKLTGRSNREEKEPYYFLPETKHKVGRAAHSIFCFVHFKLHIDPYSDALWSRELKERCAGLHGMSG